MSRQILLHCVFIALMLGISISSIVVVILGIMYDSQCPLQSYIELFVIIIFSLLGFRILFSFGTRFTLLDDWMCTFCCPAMFKLMCFTDLFLVFWLIAGSIWILRIYPPFGSSRNPSQQFYFFVASAATASKHSNLQITDSYCNQVIFMFYYVYLIVPCGFFCLFSVFGLFKRLVWGHW